MPFTTSVLSAPLAGHATPLLAIGVPAGSLPASLAPLDNQTGGALGRLYSSGDFTGKKDEQALLHPGGPAARVLLLGLGPAAEVGRTIVRRAAAVAAKRARALGLPSLSFFLAPEGWGSLSARDAGQVIAEGLPFGQWSYNEMKLPPEEKKPELETAVILAPTEAAGIQAGHAVGAAIAAGQALTRTLQVLPGNVCTPSYLAAQADALIRRLGLKGSVLDLAAIRGEKMGGLLAVAQGSIEEPRFIIFEYDGASGPPVVLIGKGVTFDTGGISIKPADKMEEMKYDMSGAAAVFGTFEMLGRLKPKVRVIGLVPTTENMPSGTAVKPGDVIKSHFGKTIEVINTDAEGRLILCDALSYARRYEPACVVDAATLTGAVIIALGHVVSGVMGTDDKLVEELRQAGERAGERVWPLPLFDEYREQIKSEIADVKNTGGRPAGTITAGWFLREFVKGYPWAHIDIAGTAYSDREDAGRVKGPTGVCMRLFAEFLLGRAGT
ncbi:MAG TPA: leucyl aminopeptidase [Gemmatimonadales bacterium]|nr:leucyl aminopeptidase [Gemmatimonadales bacterium]